MKSCTSSRSGERGGTTVVSSARLRTRSTDALVKKTVTLRPAVRPPHAMVNPTEDSSWSVPRVMRTTRLRLVSVMEGSLDENAEHAPSAKRAATLRYHGHRRQDSRYCRRVRILLTWQ